MLSVRDMGKHKFICQYANMPIRMPIFPFEKMAYGKIRRVRRQAASRYVRIQRRYGKIRKISYLNPDAEATEEKKQEIRLKMDDKILLK